MHLIADKLDGGHVSGVGSIPVIIRARATPFFGIKTKSQRHLRLIDTNYSKFMNHDKNLDSSNSLDIFLPELLGTKEQK